MIISAVTLKMPSDCYSRWHLGKYYCGEILLFIYLFCITPECRIQLCSYLFQFGLKSQKYSNAAALLYRLFGPEPLSVEAEPLSGVSKELKCQLRCNTVSAHTERVWRQLWMCLILDKSMWQDQGFFFSPQKMPTDHLKLLISCDCYLDTI